MPSSSRMLCSSSTTRTLVSATDHRKAKGEGTAGAWRRFHGHVAAMILHDAVDEGEPESGTIQLGREERLEDVADILRRDAFTAVHHADFQAVTRRRHRHAQLATVRHRLDRVEADVPECLPE